MAETDLSAESLARRVSECSISCRSMVVTLFGDAISQHGGWVWLGSLIEALAPLGYNERLVRTAVFRLVQQDWLQVNKIGRRSYYRFTATAMGHYQKAAQRIYSAGQEPWDGFWILVSPLFVPEDSKETLRKSLLWQGYNSLVSGMFAHPSADRTALDETLRELNLVGKVAVFLATAEDIGSQSALQLLVQEKWNLSELQNKYRDFLTFYKPFNKKNLLKKNTPGENFLLRTMIIHDYRRILLRDPDFPDAMLPRNWIGFEAHTLVKQIYQALVQSSAEYLQHTLENADGALPAPSEEFYNRFGGSL